MLHLDFNAIVQSVTILLLVTTIIVSWRQLKESARQTQELKAALKDSAYLQMIQNQTDSRISFFLQYPDLLKWHLTTRGFETQGETADRIRLYVLVKLDMHENMYLKHLDGTLGHEPWAAWHNVMKCDFGVPEFQEVWNKVHVFYAPSFTGHVRNELQPFTTIATATSETLPACEPCNGRLN